MTLYYLYDISVMTQLCIYGVFSLHSFSKILILHITYIYVFTGQVSFYANISTTANSVNHSLCNLVISIENVESCIVFAIVGALFLGESKRPYILISLLC